MSTVPTVAPTILTAQAVSATPLSAIQLIEREIVQFTQQRAQAIANVHAVEGALQGAQRLLNLLQVEANKAEQIAKDAFTVAESEVKKVVEFVEKEI